MGKLKIDDLPVELQKELGIKPARQQQFSKESVRSWSLKALALLGC